MNSKIGNVILGRLCKIIHPLKISDEKISISAIRGAVMKTLAENNEKMNAINFLKNYPNKTIAIDIPALIKVLDKVETINELITFFSSSPLEVLQSGKP